MSYKDKEIQCFMCDIMFTFTAGEQETFATKGYTNEPKRCPFCRAIKRAGNSDSSEFSSNKPRREMYPAVCTSCGKDTKVPFVPRNGRPVYCSNCFSQVTARRY